MDLLYEIGGYGPGILMFLSWYLLWDNQNLFFYYNIGTFANIILNVILKGLIQEPRPMFDSKKISLLKIHKKEYFFQNGIPFDIYGMPSGHAQGVFFSTIYIFLCLKQKKWLYIYLLISLLTCYQRVKYDYHYLSQVIVGSIIGASFGYFVYELALKKIKGLIKIKPDDFAPI
jgi:membrane-associated phospholipid phosphatase